MPLCTYYVPNAIPGDDNNVVHAYANVYRNRFQGTIELGARIYSSQQAAMDRANSNSIRYNLIYLGAVEIHTVITPGFVESHTQAYDDRVEDEARQREREEEELLASVSSNEDNIDSAHSDEGVTVVQINPSNTQALIDPDNNINL